MKTILTMCGILSATPLLGAAYLLNSTPAEVAQLAASRKLIITGDLSPIYDAYSKRDLKRLWKLYDLTSSGYLAKSKFEAARAGLDEKIRQNVYAVARDYTGRLLGQIPGHAKYLGDEVDAIAADPESNILCANYLHRLAKLASDESLHEIGRFWDDPRGRRTPEQEKATIEAYRIHPSDAGVNLPTSVYHIARKAMWEAKYEYPWLRSGQEPPIPMLSYEADFKKVKEWWNSPESAKYREPIDLTRKPPEEPPPQRLDLQAISLKILAKEKVAKAMPAPPLVLATPPKNESAPWPLYVAGGAALACLLWLYARKKKAA